MKIKFEHIKKVYFLGIGGIGMSAIARYFLRSGKEVHGYDLTETPLTKELCEEGAHIHYTDTPSLIPKDTDLIVYTPAIPDSLKEYIFVKNTGFPLYKRSKVLGLITGNQKTIAVAGTHGKTSTTSLIAHIMHQNKINVNAFIGGVSKNLNSNFLFTPGSEYIVVEADEFDRSFLTLHPWFAVITSVDPDHLDIYKSYRNLEKAFALFLSQMKPGGRAIVKKGLDIGKGLISIEEYSAKEESCYYASSIEETGVTATFDLHLQGNHLQGVTMGIPGYHNIENAVAAAAVAYLAGVPLEGIRAALANYTGVKRRFDIRVNKENIVYIDDYAHHPEELNACIDAVRRIWPDKKITGVFQPHLFSRTRDFADEFARSLEKPNNIILLDIYPAREEPIDGITAEWLYQKIENKNKRLMTRDEVPAYIKNTRPELLITLGAGDIDRIVEPIENIVKEW
ncbi:MAG: UDP-N-acetylmuramate--L-alanine ligase [Bacteroidales bacterium]|nr:UDP-N-acetylmuramate--L-alanine ligase [Bacteroidales bacterium]